MVTLEQLQTSLASTQNTATEYRCRVNLNIYDSPICKSLATQAAVGRYLRVIALSTNTPEKLADGENHALVSNSLAVQVCLCEDDYPGWMKIEDLNYLEKSPTNYQAIAVSLSEIQARLPQVIAFTHNAMNYPNYYLWGGTVGPNYDCSGLIQTAFAAVGIWLPRDSYQQEAFTQKISFEELQPGDLVFFGTPEKVTHVALYLGDECYIHSSGKEVGRNGIGIDRLSENANAVSQAYYRQLKSAGRVVASYQPKVNSEFGIRKSEL